MIDKKLIAAGYAAAVGSIIIVPLLLGAAFLSDIHRGSEQEEPAAVRNTSEASETEQAQAQVTAQAEEENTGEAWVEEQSDLLSTVMDQTNTAAEIMTLSGNELWSRFDGAVLTGDSRVVGFSLYTGIPAGRVKARNGATIAELSGFVHEIAALKPQRVFVAYGINDIKSSVGGKTASQYAEYAEEEIAGLEEALDGAEIFVNSILPVSPSLAEQDPVYRKVDEYNSELRKMCAKRGWHYIDNDSLAAEHGDLYVSDGIHLEAGFYEHWGRNMLIVQAGVHIDEGGTGVDR